VADLRGRRVLLGVTGGIAAYKAAFLARSLMAAGADVSAILTDAATRFIGLDTFAGLTGNPAYASVWDAPGEVLHVRLAYETDLLVIAPATANTIAKLAHGLSDDLLSAVALEYRGPVVLAPAMHEGMWQASATQHNIGALRERGVRIVGPTQGELAHGDTGWGRMAEPEDIAAVAIEAVAEPQTRTTTRTFDALAGRHVVITAGPTHEPIDPVRFVGNRSSGKMGVALASEALSRGARVTLILGPGSVRPPVGVDVVEVETAEQMRAAATERAATADVIVMAAAVADFRPKVTADRKLKKEHGVPELVLEPTPDILAELANIRRPGQLLVGFAAETDDVDTEGRSKLRRKRLDLLVANAVGRAGTGFGADTNHAAILSAAGDDVALRTWTKAQLAAAVWDRIAALLAS
jgi:phosphopantothenoylcysteine decarboxylase/phosphopantothenate--cysteine ligase